MCSGHRVQKPQVQFEGAGRPGEGDAFPSLHQQAHHEFHVPRGPAPARTRLRQGALPCEYELCLTDGSGNPVTDIQKAHADMATPDERARVSRPMFTLKAGIDYPPDERYFLVCRDKETGEITWKEEFTIDMAFAPSVDFGF